MITKFCSFNLHFVNCKLLFCVILLLSQPILVMYAYFLYGLEPWSISSLKNVSCKL
jgi:hypothetical protein